MENIPMSKAETFSDNLAQSTESILFTDTHARLSRATAHSWPASAILFNPTSLLFNPTSLLFNPTSLLFNPTSLSRTQQKEASCGASPRGVAHKCTFPKMCINLSKAVHALSFLVWLYVTRLIRPNKYNDFLPFLCSLTTPSLTPHIETYVTECIVYMFPAMTL